MSEAAGGTPDRPKATRPAAPRPTRRRQQIEAQRFQTRMALVQAARSVFEDQGFLRATVSEIARRAGVAHGTFYIYFDSKDHVFHEIASVVLGETMVTRIRGSRRARLDPADPIDALRSIEESNRAYLLAYSRNAKMMTLIEQVATLTEELIQIRHERFRAFVARTERSIRKLQEHGLADPGLDLHHTALALTGMASRMAFFAYVLHEEVDLDAMVAALTRTWTRALELDHHLPAAP